MVYNPKILASGVERGAYLHESASNTTFSLAFLCLQVEENDRENSTHLAYLELTLAYPLMKDKAL